MKPFPKNNLISLIKSLPVLVRKGIHFCSCKITNLYSDKEILFQNNTPDYYSPLLSYLKDTQLVNGSFENSPFQTSLILTCLGNLKDNHLVKLIADGAIKYLLSQVSSEGSWNYLDRYDKKMSVPDDLDDTSLVLTAITLHNPRLITEEIVLSFVQLLVGTETREGGPYFTWIVPETLRETWNDIDPVVNSNIRFFLNLHKIQLDPLDNFLDTLITEDALSSKYYSRLHINFFLSKWKTCSKKKLLMKSLVRSYPKITTVLDRALFTSTYLNFGGTPEKVAHDIKLLLKMRSDQLISDPFYIEEIENGITTYAGSKVLTAAHIIQALALYDSIIHKPNTDAEASHKQLITSISRLAIKQLYDVDPGIQTQLRRLLKKMSEQKKSSEIFLLPYLWHQALLPQYQKTFSGSETNLLCVANILGWIGFSICDSIIDGERKNDLLPLANICIREVSEIFRSSVTNSDHYQKVNNILNKIDCASAWEYENCKVSIEKNILNLPKILPDYGNLFHLANKSLGHALGPIILSFPKRKQVQQFFTHYLIARQLNDDAHDWLADLEEGLLNPISVLVIKEFLNLNPGRTHINLETDQEVLQSLFWNITIDNTAREIKVHIYQARKAMDSLSIFKDTAFLESLLTPLEQSADQALSERDSTIRFLEKYH